MTECIKCGIKGDLMYPKIRLCSHCLESITDCKNCNLEFCNNKYINCILIKEFKRELASTLERFL